MFIHLSRYADLESLLKCFASNRLLKALGFLAYISASSVELAGCINCELPVIASDYPYNEDEYYDEVSEDKDADAASFDIDETVDTNDEE